MLVEWYGSLECCKTLKKKKNPTTNKRKKPLCGCVSVSFTSAARPSTAQAHQSRRCVGGDLCPNAICGGPSHTEKVYLDLDWLLCNVAVSMVTIFYSTRGA